MKADQRTVRSTTPHRAIPWLLALGCTSLFYGLWVSAGLAAVGYHRAALEQSLIAELSSRSIRDVSVDRRFAPLFADERRVKRVSAMLAELEEGNYEHAEQSLAQPALLHEARIIPLRRGLEQLAGLETAVDESKFEIHRLEEEKHGLLKRYNEARTQLCALLRVSDMGDMPAPSDDPFSFYEQGLLSGFPVIPGIPDGLSNNQALAAVSGVSPGRFTLMKVSLENMRQSAIGLQSETAGFIARRAAYLEKSKEQERRLHDVQTELRSSAQSVFLSYRTNDLPRYAKPLYDRVRLVAERLGYALPPLA